RDAPQHAHHREQQPPSPTHASTKPQPPHNRAQRAPACRCRVRKTAGNWGRLDDESATRCTFNGVSCVESRLIRDAVDGVNAVRRISVSAKACKTRRREKGKGIMPPAPEAPPPDVALVTAARRAAAALSPACGGHR